MVSFTYENECQKKPLPSFLGFKKDTEKTSIEKTMRSTEMVVTSASLIP